MVPFERVVVELRSLYGPAHTCDPPTSPGGEHSRPPRPLRQFVLPRYDELLATAAVMVGAACPPQPFSAGDRLWLEEALVGLGFDVRAPSRG